MMSCDRMRMSVSMTSSPDVFLCPVQLDKEVDKLTEAIKPYCVCEQLYDEARPMLSCDHCEDWCVKATQGRPLFPIAICLCVLSLHVYQLSWLCERYVYQQHRHQLCRLSMCACACLGVHWVPVSQPALAGPAAHCLCLVLQWLTA